MRTPWYRSKWLRIGGVVLLVAVAIALAVPLLIPVDRYRPLLEQVIKAGTGREVQIAALRLHLLPTVHIQALNVRVKNPPGFPQGDTIAVKSVNLGIAVGPLLSRRLDVTYVAISGAQVHLLRTPAGRTNYELSTPPRGAPSRLHAASQGGAPFLTLDHVGAVVLRDSEIAFGGTPPGRGQTAPSFAVSGLNARIRSIDPTAPDWLKKLDIVADLRGVKLTTSSLTKPVQFKSGLLFVKGGAARGTFSATLDTLRVNATAALASFDPLSVTFTAAIPELDVGRLKSLVSSSMGGSAGGKAPASSSTTPPAPRRLLARGEVKIDKLVAPPLEAARVNGRLSVYTNAVQLDSYSLSAFGGTLQGAAALNYSAASLPTDLTAKVRGINLAQAMSVLAPKARKIAGGLDADLKVATALGGDPLAALRGAATFSAVVDTMRARGTVALASLNPLSATFTLATPELDVDRLKSLVNDIAGGSTGRRAPASTSTTSPAPRRLLARGEVKIDKLVAPPLEATQVNGRLSVYTNTVQLDSYSLSAYGGTVQGVAAFNYSAAALPAVGTVTAHGVNLQRVMSALAPQARRITGTLEGALKWGTALGGDPLAAMTGDGTFAVRNGSFPGLDLKGNLVQMAQALQLNVPAGETRFSYFGGDLHIAQQRVSSNSLRLDGENLNATAHGSCGFDKTLDYTGIGALKNLTSSASSEGAVPSVGKLLGQLVPGAAGATGVRVPFTLRGTVDNPKFSLAGTPELIKNQAPQQPAQQQPQQPTLPSPQDLFKIFQ